MLPLQDLEDSHPGRTFRLFSLPAVLCLLVTALFSVCCKSFAFFARPDALFSEFYGLLRTKQRGVGVPLFWGMNREDA
jgi:hypothetical protein